MEQVKIRLHPLTSPMYSWTSSQYHWQAGACDLHGESRIPVDRHSRQHSPHLPLKCNIQGLTTFSIAQTRCQCQSPWYCIHLHSSPLSSTFSLKKQIASIFILSRRRTFVSNGCLNSFPHQTRKLSGATIQGENKLTAFSVCKQSYNQQNRVG